MKIGIISDTHDQRIKILEAIDIFNERKVELVIHCGDWVAPFTAARFSTLMCPIKGVFGNNDGDKVRHRERNDFIEYYDDKMELEIGGRKLVATHGHISGMAEDLVRSGKYDAVFSGHNHIAHLKIEGKTLWLNPGTLVDETNDKTKGMSIAIYDTENNNAEIIKLG
ncbi:MAG: metallophosphoesterase [Candidatus Aenigmarchaeota archaeon]|nr:metallophosphoesterase [Candidatus Aenigmarchaeota archaeon]